ncbi:MAG: GNAT family N-acetyltransferase [Roseburia sp.]|nr:GNAT family N-acetyltransferase [Roseburia sp.]
MLETKDLILDKGKYEDWEDLYHNIWTHSESTKYMLWKVVTSEEEAKERQKKAISNQERHPYCWTVYEKKSGQAIGWATFEEIEEGVFEDQGIAIGPAFVGQGYGKQIVNAAADFFRDELGAKKMILSYRSQNIACKKMQEACGFVYSHSVNKVDPRDGQPYVIEYTVKELY